MRHSDLTLCLITDEVSPSLDEGLAFARAEGIGTVDLRVIDGRNVLALSRAELADAAKRVRAAGLSVTCICTPLLKWSPAGKVSQREGRPVRLRARLLGAKRRRRASLRGCRAARGAQPADLQPSDVRRRPRRRPAWAIDDLLAPAQSFDMKLDVENEGVATSPASPTRGAGTPTDPRRARPDIATAYRRGLLPSAADLVRLLPFSDILDSRTTPMKRGVRRCR